MTTLRAGVIGLGFAGTQHLTHLQSHPDVTVLALAGQEPERLKHLASEHGVPDTYNDWEDLVARTDLDIVSVATPNALHMPIAVAALQSGKHVLSEKPLARTSTEAQAMVDAAAANDRVLFTAFNHRRRGDVMILKQHIDDGKLGSIYYAKAKWLRRAGIPGKGTWFGSKQLAGGGPLIDLGVHVLDMALYLMGEPTVVSVTASTYAELGHRGVGFLQSAKTGADHAFEVEDLASAFLRTSEGATLTLEASWAGFGPDTDAFGVTLYGTEGGGQIDVQNYATSGTLKLISPGGELDPETPAGTFHGGVINDFIAAIQSGDFKLHRGLDGLARTKIIDACYASASSGREVRLD